MNYLKLAKLIFWILYPLCLLLYTVNIDGYGVDEKLTLFLIIWAASGFVVPLVRIFKRLCKDIGLWLHDEEPSWGNSGRIRTASSVSRSADTVIK